MSRTLRDDYEAIRELHTYLPPYEDLTPEQREAHRQSYNELVADMNAICAKTRRERDERRNQS